MALKLPHGIFTCWMMEKLGLLVATSKFSLLTYCQVAQCNQKTPILVYPQGDRSGLGKPKNDKHQHLITATTSIHLPKQASLN